MHQPTKKYKSRKIMLTRTEQIDEYDSRLFVKFSKYKIVYNRETLIEN